MKTRNILVLLILSAFVLAGCQLIIENNNQTDENRSLNITVTPEGNTTTPPTQEINISEEGIVIQATEGDLVALKPEAVDPDKDIVTYYFSAPFNQNGQWQTKDGDAGRYLVTITASDGKANSSQDITVIIQKANKAPVIECPPEVVVNEGDLITLNCNIYDPEGDSVIIEYSGFMKSSTFQTTFEDAGNYTVIVKAKDKTKESTKTINIKVLNVNRAPEIKNIPDVIHAMEGDIITLTPDVFDPDGTNVSVIYSEPFDSKGVWKTKVGDAGTFTASIVASDGKATTKKEFSVEVAMKNTPPVMKKINDIIVYEGDTIVLPIEVTDRENDKVNVTVSGWMSSPTYTTTYNDAGVYSVTVTASDGVYETKQTFQVTVLDKNRPPVFKIPA